MNIFDKIKVPRRKWDIELFLKSLICVSQKKAELTFGKEG